MTETTDFMKLATGLSINEWIFLGILGSIIEFFIAAWIIRWVLKVETIVKHLEKISEQIEELPKKPVTWDDIMKK
jgi:large-conductance mechanosensitive channel